MAEVSKAKSNPKPGDQQNNLKIFNRSTPLAQKLTKPKKQNQQAHAQQLGLDPLRLSPTADTMYLEVRQLTNNLLEARKIIKALREENRTLKRMQFLQEKAITKMTHEHADTPKVLEALHEELRTAKSMNKLHIEQLAGAEKALREIHAEYGKLKEKADRYHGIIRTKNLANSDVLQQRVEELTLQLKEKEQNEMLMEGQIEELEDEVRILKAQLSGTDVNLGPRTSKKNRRYSRTDSIRPAAGTGSASPPHSAKGGHPVPSESAANVTQSSATQITPERSVEAATASVVPQTSVLKPVLKPGPNSEGVQLQTVMEQPSVVPSQQASSHKPKFFGK